MKTNDKYELIKNAKDIQIFIIKYTNIVFKLN